VKVLLVRLGGSSIVLGGVEGEVFVGKGVAISRTEGLDAPPSVSEVLLRNFDSLTRALFTLSFSALRLLRCA
jgi:hypothetical protein